MKLIVERWRSATIRDWFQVSLFCNNYLGFTVVLYRRGLTVAIKLHDVKR